MTDQPMPARDRRKTAAYGRGIVIFLVLAALTIIELAVSTATSGSPVLLFIIALIKASLILQYFMHVSSLWREEAH